MTIVEDIEKIWNSEEMSGLESTLINLFELINTSYREGELLPLRLECDIILTGNEVIAYGNRPDESNHIISLFHRAINNQKFPEYLKFNKFTSLVASALLSAMTTDEQNNSRVANTIMGSYGSKLNHTRIELISLLLPDLITAVTQSKITKWSFEATSFIITFMCILKHFQKWNSDQEEMIQKLAQSLQTYRNSDVFNDWKGTWLANSDYFRLSTLMIWGDFVDDEKWQTEALTLFP